jgi:hypothetical protein
MSQGSCKVPHSGHKAPHSGYKVETILFSLAQEGHILGDSLGMCPHLHWRAAGHILGDSLGMCPHLHWRAARPGRRARAQVSLKSNPAPVKRLRTSHVISALRLPKEGATYP